MWVVNHTEHPLEDGYEGTRYKFPIGVPVEIHPAVANHVFGYGDDDKTPYLIRLGWMRHTGELEQATKRLALFSFSTNKPTKAPVHSLSPVVEAKVPVPDKKGAGAVVRLAA